MSANSESSTILPRRACRKVQAAFFALFVLGSVTPIDAQQIDTVPKKGKGKAANPADTSKAQRDAERIIRESRPVTVWEAGAAVGAILLVSTLDEPIARWVQRNRSKTLTDVADVFKQQGEPWYYVGMSLGVWGTGVILNNSDVRRAGRRLVASVLVAGVATYALKPLVGRSRPNETAGAFNFHPFTSLKDSAGVETRGSLPSGHALAAFAVATSLADDIDHPIASALLYTAATGAAWSRVYDNRHWFSDVLLGTILGVTTSKVISGRWRVFGFRPPAILVRPTGAAIEWKVPITVRHSPRFPSP